jgi:hypothetical protein
LNQYWICNEVKPYLSGSPAGIKVTSHRIFQLVLKLPQILALRCYATIPRRIIPGSDENPRFLGYPYLKYDFVHVLHITAALAEGQRTVVGSLRGDEAATDAPKKNYYRNDNE